MISEFILLQNNLEDGRGRAQMKRAQFLSKVVLD